MATLTALVVGVVAGYLLARTIVLRVAEERLIHQTSRSLVAADADTADVRAVLATMNASPYPYCSDAELTYFRHVLFRSANLREGGRMDADGRIDCSTTLGREALPQERFKSIVTDKDGSRVYWNLAPFRISQQVSSVLQAGTAYVDGAMQVHSEGLPPGASMTLSLRDVQGRSIDPAANNPSAKGLSYTTEGYRNVDGRLSDTRCSAVYPYCVTGEIAVADAFHMGRSMFAACMNLMGLVGVVLGLSWTFAYCRKWTRGQQLRRAIRRDELRIAYQPVVDLASGRIVGAEALARWTDEDGLEVPPDVFIPLAEQGGFVGEITRLVLRHVLCDLGDLLRSVPGFQVHVNVTAWDLAAAGFVPRMEVVLERAGVSAESVAIEITETSTANNARAIEGIRQMRLAGHRVYIDDFGTGYSSLAYLQELSVDAIKIDKVFTQAIGTGSLTVSLLPQILAMAAALNLEVVVEGIEKEAQAQYFAARGKRLRGQGWLYGRPMPVGEFLKIVAADQESRNRKVMRNGYGQDRRCAPSAASTTA